MRDHRFYDIHFHALTWAHPNILAFIRRINWPLLVLASPLAAIIGGEKIRNAKNLLSVMDNDIGSFFLLVEYFLKKTGTVNDHGLTIGSMNFDSVVVTPLMIDFGYKNIRQETFYNIPPQKPIVQQVEDVFNGIARYCTNELVQYSPTSYEVIPRTSKSIFEIYPFLGINTLNYDLSDIMKMLDKYFKDYQGNYSSFKNNLGKFDGDIDEMKSNFFAGIKLYPPIGFDPWPVGKSEELDKVVRLYEFCCCKQIPVTVHCSDGGFILDKKHAQEFTSPGQKWKLVLSQEKFKTLKLNFAHFGKQSKRKFFVIHQHDWRDQILQLMKTCPNIYTDFSCLALDDDDYQALKIIYKENPYIKDRILFGSDFMMNLLHIESYNRYLELFSATGFFDDSEKEKLCNMNSERFLWRT
ncbi:MAG: amidohydrolase family protein [Syntrophales bacterium]|jgi:hypothetical protein